ncbi:MAG TPA: radical SAM protein, partial [archaeon]|nr:radical SAM protein [archaeon]
MNILLVAPPYYRDVTIFPLGLAYVAAVLKNEGQNVEVLDLSVDTEKMPVLGDYIVKTQPDMIGITCATQTFRSALEVAKIAKQSLPEVKVIVGGPHPTIMKENILKHPEFDIAVIGEGEETIAELSHILEVGGSLCSVQGIIWKQGEKIHSNEQRPLIKNLDSLPFPARNLFPLSRYKVAGSIQTSRGCPYRCIYCITSNISPGRTWRARSPANVIAEMQMMYHEFNIRRFQIMDDDFTVNRKRVF